MSTSLFIGIMVASILWVLGGILIWPNYKRSGNKIVSDFAKMLIWAGAGLIWMSIAFYQAKFIIPRIGMGWFMVIAPIGALIKSIGILYIVKVLFALIGKYQKTIMRISLFIFWTFFATLFYNRVAFALSGKGALLIFPKGIGYYFDVWFIPVILIPTVWLLVKSLGEKEERIKIKGILVGLAFVLFVVNMQACGAAGVIKPVVFNWPTVTYTSLVMIGIIYLSKRKKPEEALTPFVSAASAVAPPPSPGGPRVQW